ncbi:MAG: acyl-CoA dehydrogenase [Proteobacteria bacterium]|nr:MAG: acyl-CoA dehydrogenase [Pseudomonadota bacterium]TDJ72140.1 MAG: acyl-CoA dehydrogenase [Pseudomonadota bacterium]
MTREKAATNLKAWVGRQKAERDVAVAGQAQAMAALLDRDSEQFRIGTVLPEYWHWIYFKPVVAQSLVGTDGHPRRGTFLPPIDLPRRMWAGGRLQFLHPIGIGDEIERKTEILSVEEKDGRSGKLVVLKLRHLISNASGPCVDEQQDLVYCETPRPDQPSRQQAQPPDDVDWQETFIPNTVILFRFSALTFNSHRIHYDYPYVTQVEGYRGLVVHGPLTALLLLEAAKRHATRAPSSYEYRAIGPLFNDEPITLAGRTKETETEVWAIGPTGAVAMQGHVSWET